MEFNIKLARERAGLTQKELAQKIGVAPSTLNGYEKGNHDPKSDLIIKIALICDVSVDYLLGRTDDPTPKNIQQSQDTPKLSLHERDVALAYRKANDDTKLIVDTALKPFFHKESEKGIREKAIG